MEIHNLMEDVVDNILNDTLKEMKDICKCHQCWLDMKCYALNKLKPMYVVSSRGIIHSQNNKRSDSQIDIDVYSVVMEAINVVSKTRRHDETSIVEERIDFLKSYKDSFYFVFPSIIGRIIDSSTLTPVSGASVKLVCQSDMSPAVMINDRWANPLQIVKQMNGSFNFWPSPVKASKKGIQKTFDFIIQLDTEGYSVASKYFEITLVSIENSDIVLSTKNFYQLDDIYMVKDE